MCNILCFFSELFIRREQIFDLYLSYIRIGQKYMETKYKSVLHIANIGTEIHRMQI